MPLIAAILIFIFGTAIGSFLSVIMHRLRTGEKGAITGRSICPACKKQIKWRHLIPIFSWIYLRGKCAYCGKSISSHYLVLELITGLSFLAIFLNWNFVEVLPSITNTNLLSYTIDWQIFEKFIFYLLEFTFLIAIFFYDLMHKEIPDSFSLPAIGIAIAGGLVFGMPEPMSMLIGALAIGGFFLVQFIFSRGAWIGGGDLRFGVLMGVLLGWKMGIIALVLSYFIGAGLSLILILQEKVNRKSAIPFGPFLVMGTVITIFWGQQILDWYLGTLMI